jgi:hypothetical protein
MNKNTSCDGLFFIMMVMDIKVGVLKGDALGRLQPLVSWLKPMGFDSLKGKIIKIKLINRWKH